MDTLDEILGAFEETLELERELGTRTIPCDRALLVPLSAVHVVPPPSSRAESASTASATTAATNAKGHIAAMSVAASKRPQASESSVLDFAFIISALPQGGAATLLDKMIAAMGYTRERVVLTTAAAAAQVHPAARVYVILGSDAFRVFVPGQRASLGLWTKVDGVPAVVTYSPTRILAFLGDNAPELRKAKMQIWSDLRAALAQIGKRPPA